MNIVTISSADPKRNIITLKGNDAFSAEVRYEPLQHSLRVMHAGVQRLFFYEQDDFFNSKTTLLNEYGLVVGKLQWRSRTKGNLQLNDTRLSFINDPEDFTAVIQHPAFPEGVHWNYAPLQGTGLLENTELFRALLMILTWSVSVSTLQA